MQSDVIMLVTRLVPTAASLLFLLVVACGETPDAPGVFSVPIDEARPEAGAIHLRYVRYPATNPESRIGVLLMHFGGPGSSAVDNLRQRVARWTEDHPELRRRFDLVGFDEIGVGMSQPIDCQNRQMTIPMIGSSTEAEALADAQSFADDCKNAYPELLGQLGTARLVRDIERFRIHLGEDRINFLGYSYGSMVGLAYAATFPQRVRTLVLDGIVDPNTSWETWNVETYESYEATLNDFLDTCSRQASCIFGGGDARATFENMMTRLPLTPHERQGFSQAEVLRAAVRFLSFNNQLPDFDDALAAAARQDFGPLRHMLDHDEVGTGAYYGTLCPDMVAPDLETVRQMQHTLRQSAPWYGRVVSPTLPCLYWGAEAQPGNWDLTRVPGSLLINSVLDPRTPIVWAHRVQEQTLENAFIEVSGYHHGHSFISRRDCIDNAVLDYLITAELPTDTPCR